MKKHSKARLDGAQAYAQPTVGSKSRLIGMGAIVLVGLFGLLLAAQVVSPLSSADDSENTSCVSDAAAAKTASQLGFYETRPTGEDWSTEALTYIYTELTASELAEVEKGDNSWIRQWEMDECFDLLPRVSMERILSMDKWLTGRRLWKYNVNDASYWMPAAEAEEYAKRLNAHQAEDDEERRQYQERRREQQARQKAEQEAEQEPEEVVEETVVDNPPVLRLEHRNTVMTATARDDNLNLDSWQNAGPFAADPDCESEDLTYSPAGSDQHSLTLTPADNNQWYCFKVSDTGNNTGYVKYQVKGVFIEEAPVPQQQSRNIEQQQEEQDDKSDNQKDQEDDPVLLQTDPSLSNQVPQLDARQLDTDEEEPKDLQIATGSTGSIDQGQGGQGGLPRTGDKDDGNKWTQLGGYALVAGAIVGVARILIVKKKHQSGV